MFCHHTDGCVTGGFYGWSFDNLLFTKKTITDTVCIIKKCKKMLKILLLVFLHNYYNYFYTPFNTKSNSNLMLNILHVKWPLSVYRYNEY